MNSKLIKSKEFYNAVLAEKCRRSFYFFVQQFWDVIISEPPVWSPHIKYLCDELQIVGIRVKNREKTPFDYFIINVPPGSSKSTIVSEMYVAWTWAIDDTQRFICGSYSKTPAEDIADKCKKIVCSEKYKELFGDILVSDAMTNLKTKNNGQRQTTTVGSTITGIHAHQIVIDDPIGANQADSMVERDNANRWLSSTISTRKVDKKVTPVIIVMQRLHENDPTGYLLKRKGLRIKHICLPAELPSLEDDNVRPTSARDLYQDGLLDPIRLSRETLNTMRSDLGSYGYAGQFDQRPADTSNGIIKKFWFEIVDIPISEIQNFVMDTAYTDKAQNDPSGFLSYFVKDGFLYITNWESMRLEFPQLIKYTQSFVTKNGYTPESSIRVEPKASGKSLVQQIRDETHLNIIEDEAPNNDKISRAKSITAIIESGKVKLLRGSWNEDFITEVCTFPKAQHDEAVDCLVMAVKKEFFNKIDFSKFVSVF